MRTLYECLPQTSDASKYFPSSQYMHYNLLHRTDLIADMRYVDFSPEV